jgi:hypothetical protein
MTHEEAVMRVTNGVAVGGITMPAWVPTLGEVSTTAAQAVPILSALWLAIQIIGYARKRWAR